MQKPREIFQLLAFMFIMQSYFLGSPILEQNTIVLRWSQSYVSSILKSLHLGLLGTILIATLYSSLRESRVLVSLWVQIWVEVWVFYLVDMTFSLEFEFGSESDSESKFEFEFECIVTDYEWFVDILKVLVETLKPSK